VNGNAVDRTETAQIDTRVEGEAAVGNIEHVHAIDTGYPQGTGQRIKCCDFSIETVGSTVNIGGADLAQGG